MIAATAIIHPGVKLGKNVVVEDYCILGATSKGALGGELETIIGDNSIIRSHTVIYAGNIIGENFQTGNKANIRESNEIGANVSIGTHSVIEHHVKIEDNVRIHSQVFIPEYSTLKNGSWIGPNVVLTNSKFPNQEDSKDKLEGPIVFEGARVGANSTILPGIKIGKNSLVGAGSTVTKDVAEDARVVGNPAKELKG